MAFNSDESDDLHEKLLERSASDNTIWNDLQKYQRRSRTRRCHIGVLYLTNLLLTIGISVLSISKDNCHDPSLRTYSPANVAVEYEEVVFYDMPGEWSPYFGKPTDEKDRLWDELYTGTGFLLFTPEETKKMPNQTVAVPSPDGDSGIYNLELFHQLHCLNALRKTLWSERYPEYALYHPNGTRNEFWELHHSHCIDRLRQNVQCAGNIGANYYNWREDIEDKRWMQNLQSTQTCRNFEKLQVWARSRDYTKWDERVKSHITTKSG